MVGASRWVTDKLAEEGWPGWGRELGIEVVVDNWGAQDAPCCGRALAEADGIVVRSGTQLTAEVLEGQSRLKVIVRAGVGVDNIDVAVATRRGIVVMNTPGGNTISTAEHTMALILALARNVVKANDSLKSGKWERNQFTGTQLEGKTLGVIGLGRVGLAVPNAQGFGMTVVGTHPWPPERLELGVEGSVPRRPWGRCDFRRRIHP
jgi:D-3-phosphoglycerate dehydrogenase